MKKQQAVDVGFDRRQGTLNIDELNQLLADGWTVAITSTSGGGDILVIVEKDGD
jgi:ABC-type transport system involved in Fe-S cluster assembly fused permease/ATPase subunit